MAISERSAASKKMPRLSIADGSVSDACFNDWKRFCFVLREIARGDEKGRPLSGQEAQKRLSSALTQHRQTLIARGATEAATENLCERVRPV